MTRSPRRHAAIVGRLDEPQRHTRGRGLGLQ
jgi:hypothetical protein